MSGVLIKYPLMGPESMGEEPRRQPGQPPRPQEVHDFSHINFKVLRDFHGLDLEEARILAGGLADRICRIHPLELTRMQPVVDRTLITRGYL